MEKAATDATIRQTCPWNISGYLFISGFPILNPRTVHAEVATITRDQDNPARHPFTTSCEGSSADKATSCTTPAVPAGEEVVIETISFRVVADPNNLVAIDAIEVTTAGVEQLSGCTRYPTPVLPNRPPLSSRQYNRCVYMPTRALSLLARLRQRIQTP